MQIVPSIADVQRLLDDSAATNCNPVSDSVNVLETLLCYTLQDRFEIFAVVDGDGGHRLEWDGSLPITTVSKFPPSIKPLLSAWIGEAVPAGIDLLLLAGKDGMHIPPANLCDTAIGRHKDIGKFGENLRASILDIDKRLRRHESESAANRSRFSKFDEMTTAVDIIEAQLLTLRGLAEKLDRLSKRPAARTIETLASDLAHEREDLEQLDREVNDHFAASDTALTPWRNRLEVLETEHNRLASVRQAEQARVDALYVAALLHPTPVSLDEAQAEYCEVADLLDASHDDVSTLKRRLRTLRIHCLASQPSAETTDAMEWLLRDLNALLDIEPAGPPEDSSAEIPPQLVFDW